MSVPLEEALECPKCGNKGEVKLETPIKRSRDKQLSVECVTKLCIWYGTRYTVTKKPDGTAPDPNTLNRPKAYPKLPDTEQGRLIASLDKLLEGQTKPGGAETR